MNDVKLLIFDMDDTLICVDSITKLSWIKTAEDMIEEFHIEGNGTSIGKMIGDVSESIHTDENKRPRGNYSPKEMRSYIIRETFQLLNFNHEEVIDYMVDKYDYYKKALVYVYDDVFETLSLLKQRGYILSMLTNGDSGFQREKINRLGLDTYFDKTFVSGEMGTDKPHKEAYYMICDHFGISPAHTCMIGDNYLWEVAAPKSYGLKAIWVNRDHKEIEDNQSDYTIKSISELLDIFH